MLSRAIVARLVTGNPSEQIGGRRRAVIHLRPGLADVANPQAPPTPPTEETLEPPVPVKPLATETAPIESETMPDRSALFEEQAVTDPDQTSSQPTLPGGFSTVSTLRQVVTTRVEDEQAIFRDGGPKAADVQQGSIGDCYDLASVITIVNGDPGKITSAVQPDGSGGANVSLYKRVAVTPLAPGEVGPPAPRYQLETVAVNAELAYERSRRGARAVRDASGRRILHGSQLYADDTPFKRQWFTRVVGGALEICVREIYRMARWAPLLEKASARFSEVAGQYGQQADPTASTQLAENKGRHGYDNLEGGWAAYTQRLFYGESAETGGVQFAQTADAGGAGAALLTANAAAFNALLMLTAHPAGDGGATGALVTASTWTGDDAPLHYGARLNNELTTFETTPEHAALPDPAKRLLAASKRACTNYATQAAASRPSPARMRAAKQALMTTSENALANDEIKMSQPLFAARDMMLILKNMGDDEGGTPGRSVYADHEYAVMSADIRKVGGGPTDIHTHPASQRAAHYSEVDVAGSSVTLRNPHHANVPTQMEMGQTADESEGTFSVSLERFFRLFGYVSGREVQRTTSP